MLFFHSGMAVFKRHTIDLFKRCLIELPIEVKAFERLIKMSTELLDPFRCPKSQLAEAIWNAAPVYREALQLGCIIIPKVMIDVLTGKAVVAPCGDPDRNVLPWGNFCNSIPTLWIC